MNDKWLYRLVIVFLGLIILTSIYASVYFYPKDPPAHICAIGASALGALAGILVPFNQNSKNNNRK